MSNGFGKLSDAATDFSWGSSGANEKPNIFKKANPFGNAGGGPASADVSSLNWGESSGFAAAAAPASNGFGAASFGSPAQNGKGKGKPAVVAYDEEGDDEQGEGDEGDYEGKPYTPHTLTTTPA
jgi:hypothetical protein